MRKSYFTKLVRYIKNVYQEEGIKEATIKNAKNFLIMGLDIDMVANATGLSVEEVERIKLEYGRI